MGAFNITKKRADGLDTRGKPDKLSGAVILAVALFFAAPSDGAPVSFETAENIARTRLESGPVGKIRPVSAAKLSLRKTTTAAPPYFVFEKESGGFIIIPTDDAAMPILGETYAGNFDKKTMPPALLWLLETYERQIEEAVKNGAAQDGKTTLQWERLTKRSAAATTAAPYPAKLLSTVWDQGEPYNLMTPLDGDARSLTGCVATSMAQIMKYHGYPASGTGTSEAYHISVPSVSFNTPYNYADMLDSYPSASAGTTAQREAVSQLMYHCGVSVRTIYSRNASGAPPTAVTTALTAYFGYDNCVRYIDRASIGTSDNWKDLIIGQIENSSPVFYNGGETGTSNEHAFIIDGYDNGNDLFHINWGWGGNHDGFFALTALNPDAFLYNDGQGMIINIMPDKGGNPPSQIKVSGFYASATQTAISASVRAMVYYGADFSCKIGVAVMSNGAISMVLDSAEVPISYHNKETKFCKKFDANTPSGRLILQTVVKHNTAVWTPTGETLPIDITIGATAFNGAGTEQNPYRIAGAADLAELASLVNVGDTGFIDKHYIMTANIDLDLYNWDMGWTPIGNHPDHPFFGTFDGNGKTIRGLKINRNGDAYAGLFGYIYGGTVKNVGVIGADINNGRSNTAGSIAGYAGNSAILNCSTINTDIRGDCNIGGIVGYVNGSTISNCYTIGNVSGRNYAVGGIVGYVDGSTISNCYTIGNVSCDYIRVGGIAGYVNGSTISNCYTIGNVSSSSYYAVGGIVGVIYESFVKNNAALNQSVVGNYDVGRVIGQIFRVGTSPNNLAWNGMALQPDITIRSDATGIHGADISAAQINADSTIGGLFTESPWTTEFGKLPGFGAAVDMPEYLLPPICVVRFDLSGGSGTTPASISDVANGSTLAETQKPSANEFTKSGHVSDGKWYTRRTRVWGDDTTVTYTEFVFGPGGTAVTYNVTLYLRWTSAAVAIQTNDRDTPQTDPINSAAAVVVPAVPADLSASSNTFTAGPNPVGAPQAASIHFFRTGSRIKSASLYVYDAFGNVINKITVNDKSTNYQHKRVVGKWDLKDGKGRKAPDGAYLVKGAITATDGKKENVALILGVR